MFAAGNNRSICCDDIKAAWKDLVSSDGAE
jgi:hypothetical protein